MSENEHDQSDFDELAQSLEEVVRELESGDLSPGLSRTLSEQGLELGRELSERLQQGQRELQALMSRDQEEHRG